MEDNALQKKRRFFHGLDRLQSESDPEDDGGRTAAEQFLASCRADVRAKDHGPLSEALQRSMSDSHVVDIHLSSPLHGTFAPSPVDDSLKPNLPPMLIQRHSDAVGGDLRSSAIVRSLNLSRASGKRKRQPNAQWVPQEQQIFKTLHFFFFPNNNVHPGRRLRIDKAIEFGATWEKEWNDAVTHIIADKSIEYSFITRFLGIGRIPAHVVCVNENYPPDCISFRSLLAPDSHQYHVKQAPVQQSLEHHLSVKRSERPLSSERSLKLKAHQKPSRKRVISTPGADPSSPDASPTSARPTKNGTKLATESASVGQIASTAEFEAAVQQARALQYVPLDEGEAEDAGRDESINCLPRPSRASMVSTHHVVKQDFASKFQCMQKNTGESIDTPNHATITILQQMADYYDLMGDEWRTRAYRRAITTLRRHAEKICTKAQALKMPQIGERIAEKIEEIVVTNRLRRLDNALAEPHDQILQTFMQIYGVGFRQARGWVEAGFKSLEDVVMHAELTAGQRVGIEHYDDFRAQIPRAEVEQAGEHVRRASLELNPGMELIIGGSYRRGSQTSGDIDCILTHPTLDASALRTLVFDRLVPNLMDSGFLVAELSSSARHDGSRWLGACQLPASAQQQDETARRPRPWRRIDFFIAPACELGAALVAYTGNDIFNRSLRLLAGTKGLRLNQRGLYKDVLRGRNRSKLSEGTLIEGRDEMKIFAALGVPWRPPEHRVC